jgi:energy-coupling factor transporter transmembrane protein EcfT
MTMMIGWWIAVVVMLGAALGTLGSGLICIVPVWFVVPIISAFTLASKQTNQTSNIVESNSQANLADPNSEGRLFAITSHDSQTDTTHRNPPKRTFKIADQGLNADDGDANPHAPLSP